MSVHITSYYIHIMSVFHIFPYLISGFKLLPCLYRILYIVHIIVKMDNNLWPLIENQHKNFFGFDVGP